MPELYPDNFREVISSFLLAFGLIFAFLSLKETKKEHTLRLTGILFILALALFSNNWQCYFAAIFIVATAITQLDFLQNLAAIIRNSKGYFEYKYKKEFLTQEEVEEKIEKDIEEIEKIEKEPTTVPTQAFVNTQIKHDQVYPNSKQFTMKCEEYTLRYFERKYKQPIQRHIRIRHKSFARQFDGILERDNYDIIFEIKVMIKGKIPISIPIVIYKYISSGSSTSLIYKSLTNRKAKLLLIFVGNFTDDNHDAIEQLESLKTLDDNFSYEILSFKDIGIEGDTFMKQIDH
ncbi:hypothetical protein ACFL6K_03695 [Candidatus Latescibacterota bacterium]